MGDILARLKPDELNACQVARNAINDQALRLGLMKRGHQHLWNELAQAYQLVGKKIELDYETGLITETTQPSIHPSCM